MSQHHDASQIEDQNQSVGSDIHDGRCGLGRGPWLETTLVQRNPSMLHIAMIV